VDAFEQWVRGAAEVRGIEVDETDVTIIRYIHGVYGPHLSALQAADLTGVWEEPDLDPGRAPSDAKAGA
jgi:hypothetical protein